jgi:prepilin-type N-terminal cleavage/methylation domain-containing protein
LEVVVSRPFKLASSSSEAREAFGVRAACCRFSRRPFTAHFTSPPPNLQPATCNLQLRKRSAFTLLELLVVMSIIALLAALAMPVMKNFKPNYAASATRQLLDDLARARQLAISQRTTVYMVFVPTNFWNDAGYQAWAATNAVRSTNMFDKQLVAYNFVSLHSMGDQPGRWNTNYLSSWKTLPEGAFIYPAKFGRYNAANPVMSIPTNTTPPVKFMRIYGFNRIAGIPFPAEDALPAPATGLPFIAFDYMGRLVSQHDEAIPLARGTVSFSRDPSTRAPLPNSPSITEQPPGNATNSFNVINIDWVTGRARAIQQEAK